MQTPLNLEEEVSDSDSDCVLLEKSPSPATSIPSFASETPKVISTRPRVKVTPRRTSDILQPVSTASGLKLLSGKESVSQPVVTAVSKKTALPSTSRLKQTPRLPFTSNAVKKALERARSRLQPYQKHLSKAVASSSIQTSKHSPKRQIATPRKTLSSWLSSGKTPNLEKEFENNPQLLSAIQTVDPSKSDNVLSEQDRELIRQLSVLPVEVIDLNAVSPENQKIFLDYALKVPLLRHPENLKREFQKFVERAHKLTVIV